MSFVSPPSLIQTKKETPTNTWNPPRLQDRPSHTNRWHESQHYKAWRGIQTLLLLLLLFLLLLLLHTDSSVSHINEQAVCNHTLDMTAANLIVHSLNRELRGALRVPCSSPFLSTGKWKINMKTCCFWSQMEGEGGCMSHDAWIPTHVGVKEKECQKLHIINGI